MKLKDYSDDFFKIGDLAILHKRIDNDTYDFDYRTHFECSSIVSETAEPVLLHIGAIEDYADVTAALNQIGMRPLVSEAMHLRCSTIEKWYPSIKEKTPYTKVFEELPDIEEILRDFSFPFFVKGNRQTNRHKKSQCIIENIEGYERLRTEWKNDPVLSWQKAAIREYVPLQAIDSTSFPDMVPISYEFRFFYFDGKCMGYGPYWTIGDKYLLSESDLPAARELANWAANRLSVWFVSVDLAKTQDGRWIIIEVNDAQESGYAGVNPIELWNNIISTARDCAKEGFLLPAEVLLPPADAVIMASEPVKEFTVEEMKQFAVEAIEEKDLASLLTASWNEAWWVEDNEYDFEEGTPEHKLACQITKAWFEVVDILENKIFTILKQEGVIIPERGIIEVLKPFMERNGYRDGRGWWVSNE